MDVTFTKPEPTPTACWSDILMITLLVVVPSQNRENEDYFP